jgi:hypothetical protein
MAPVLGKGGAPKKIYHYGPGLTGTEVKVGAYWTDFESTSPDDVSRITGQPAMYFKVRHTVQVASAAEAQYFRNVATAMKPGLGAYDEYRNIVAIPIAYLDSTPMK